MQRRMRGLLHKRVLTVLGASAVVLSGTLSWADGNTNHVRDVKIRATDASTGATEIEVVGSTAPVFNVRVESGGKRLLVDISDADVVGVKEALTSQVGIVGGVLTQGFKTETGNMTRLSVSLVKQATYRVRADGTTLKVSLTPATVTAAASAADVKAAGGDAPAVIADAIELSDVRFEKGKAGADRVLITTTAVPAYSLGTTPGGRVRLELKKTQLPKNLAKTMDLSAQHSPLKTVSAFYDSASESTIIEIDREGMAQGSIAVDGKSIIWAFDVPKLGATGGKAPSRKSVTVARERIEDGGPAIETSIHGGDANHAGDVKIEVDGTTETAGFAATVNAQAGGRFNGRRIDLDAINQSLDKRNVIPKLRSTIPAGGSTSAGT